MSYLLYTRVFLTWFLFIPVAILNAGLREKTYKPKVGDLAGHQISTLIASIAFLLFSYLAIGDLVSQSSIIELIMSGVIWVTQTILFEFVAGHYIFKNSWEKLFTDYNLLKGRIWLLFLLIELTSPLILKLIL